MNYQRTVVIDKSGNQLANYNYLMKLLVVGNEFCVGQKPYRIVDVAWPDDFQAHDAEVVVTVEEVHSHAG